jgi:dihydropteroate synthase
MGILNVTADSFSDGGRYLEPDRAVEHGLALAREGADLLDVGGESTRPGAEPVDAAEESRRVLPVIAGLRARLAEVAGPGGEGALISVDTRKAAVARQALAAGAAVVNDVSAATHDPAMADVIRESGAGLVLMHMQGEPRTMQADPRYGDVVREVRDYLAGRLAALAAAGVRPEQVAIDPGIGFGKTLEHNLRLLAGLSALRALGRPVVVGLSRKSWLGRLTGREVGDRLAASLAGMVYAVLRGAEVVRVHDVRETVDAIRVLAALRGEEAPCSG